MMKPKFLKASLVLVAYCGLAAWCYQAGSDSPPPSGLKAFLIDWGGPFAVLLVDDPARVSIFFVYTLILIGMALLAWKLKSKVYEIVIAYLVCWFFMAGFSGFVRVSSG